MWPCCTDWPSGRRQAGYAPRGSGRAYARRRWGDVIFTLLTTDLLVRLFSNRHPLLLPLRRLGMHLLARHASLRHLALGVMTHGVGDGTGKAADAPSPPALASSGMSVSR